MRDSGRFDRCLSLIAGDALYHGADRWSRSVAREEIPLRDRRKKAGWVCGVLERWATLLPTRIVNEEIGDYLEHFHRADEGRGSALVRAGAAIVHTGVNALGYSLQCIGSSILLWAFAGYIVNVFLWRGILDRALISALPSSGAVGASWWTIYLVKIVLVPVLIGSLVAVPAKGKELTISLVLIIMSQATALLRISTAYPASASPASWAKLLLVPMLIGWFIAIPAKGKELTISVVLIGLVILAAGVMSLAWACPFPNEIWNFTIGPLSVLVGAVTCRTWRRDSARRALRPSASWTVAD